MGFDYGGINQQPALQANPQPSNYSCFNEQPSWAGYMGLDIGLIPHEFFSHPYPHPFAHPCDMRSAIQIEIEKERIREEIIISEIIARRCCLEAELINLAKSGENISISGPEGNAMTLPGTNTSDLPSTAILKAKEEWSCALCQVSAGSARGLNSHLQGKKHKSKEAALTSQRAGDSCKIGVDANKVELNAQSLLVVEKSGEENPTISDSLKENLSGLVQEVQQDDYLPNPDNLGENGSETVRETEKDGKNMSRPGNSVAQPEEDTSERPSNVILKVKEEWSCSLCQVNAGSARGLNSDLQGKKHKSKEAALTSQRAGDSYKIGVDANKVELNTQSLLVVEKSGEENPTISDSLKENPSGLVQEVQQDDCLPNPDNLGENGSETVRETEKDGKNMSRPGNSVAQPEEDTSERPSNVVLKVKEEWSCALCQVSAGSARGLNSHLQGKKHRSKEAALTSQRAGDSYTIGVDANKVELNAQSLLVVEKSGEENPTISDSLKENPSGLVQEVQQDDYLPNPDNLGENGSETVRETEKDGKNMSRLGNSAAQPEEDTSERPSNVVLKVKEEWSCALCQVSAGSARGLNSHLQGKKHKSKEAALTSQRAGDSCKIGVDANKVELNAQSLLVIEKSGEENPTISDSLKENPSGLVQEVQQDDCLPNPDNLGENGSETIRETEKDGKNMSRPGNSVAQPQEDTSESPSNVVLKVKEEWGCTLCQVSAGSARGLNNHVQGKKHKSKEAALTSQRAGDSYKIGVDANKVELNAQSLLVVEKSGEENPTISDSLKENLSGLVQETQKNADTPNSDNIGKKESNSVREIGKNVDNISGPRRNTLTQPESDTSDRPSNEVAKVKEEWNCALCEVSTSSKQSLNEHLLGRKHKSKEAADNYKIGVNAKKVELKAESLLLKKTGEENSVISVILKENQSELVQEELKNLDAPNADNVGRKGPESVRETGKNGENISGLGKSTVMKPEEDKSELPSIDFLKVKEEWSCALCQVSISCAEGLNVHLHGKKHKFNRAALISQKSEKIYEIGLNANKVELKPESLLVVEKSGEENATISDNLKENHSGLFQKEQRNGDTPNPYNIGKKRSDSFREMVKNGKNASGLGRNTLMQARSDISELPSNDVLKVKKEWSCALCLVSACSERGLNMHLQGKKHKLKEAALTSPKARENYKIEPSGKKVELKAESLLVEKTGERNSTVSDNLMENQSGLIQEVQKNGYSPNPGNLGESGSESVPETGKNGEISSSSERNVVMQPEADISVLPSNVLNQLPSNVILKGKEEWSCTLCQVSATCEQGLNEHLQGKKHKYKEAALTSQKAGDNYKIGPSAKKVELKAESFLVEKTGGSNPTVSDNLKENQSGSIQELQKIGNPPNPDNLGENGSEPVRRTEKNGETESRPEKNCVMQPERDTSVLPSNVVLKVKQEWGFALNQVSACSAQGLKEYLHGMKQESQEAGLRSDKAADNYNIRLNAKTMELKAKSLLVEKTREENPTIGDNLKESQSESVQEVQKNGYPPNQNNLGKNGCNSKKMEYKAKTSLIKKIGMANRTISDELIENQSGWVQEVHENGDTPNPVKLGENGSETVQEKGKSGKNISQPPSNVILRVKDKWRCSLCQVSATSKQDLNTHLLGKKHMSIEAALTSQKAGDSHNIGINANKLELKASSLVVKPVENPTIADELKENQSGPVRKVQKNGDPPYPIHLEKNGSESIQETGEKCNLKNKKSKFMCEMYKVRMVSRNTKDVSVENKETLEVIDMAKLDENISRWERMAVMRPEAADTSEIPSNVVLKSKEDWSCALCQVSAGSKQDLNEHLQGKKHKSKESALISHKAVDNFKSEPNAKDVEYKAKTWLIKRTGEEDPTISDNLKENQSESVEEVRKNGYPPNPDNLGENGSNAKDGESKAKTRRIKRTDVENRAVSVNLMGNQSGLVQEVQENGDSQNPDNFGGNGFNAKEMKYKAKTWQIKRTGVENPKLSDNLKGNQSGSVQEVQKNDDWPNPDNLGGNGFNVKEVELKAKTGWIKRTGVENPAISDNVKKNQSGSAQEVRKNDDPPNPNSLEKNGFNAKKVEFKTSTWVMKKTGDRQSTSLGNLKESPSEVQEAQKNGCPPNRDSIGGSGSVSAQETGRNGDPKNKKYSFWCEMCKVGTISRKDMNEHEKGKKHDNQVRKSDRNGESGSKLKIWLKKETEMHG